MSNPTRSLIAFTYIAAGHTHIRTSQVIVPNLAADLTLLPAPIDASTYVKTIGGQWVQIHLGGADPKSMTLEAKFEVGIKANVSYAVDVEAEGEAALKISDLKPLYAAEVIRSTGAVMLNKATSLGLNMDVANLASNAATILKTGLNHLVEIEPQYENGFGNVSLDIKLTGGIGVGAWDSAISAVSVNSTFNVTAPLLSFIEVNAGMLEEFLTAGLGMADANLKLGTAILENDPNVLATHRANVKTATDQFIQGVLDQLLNLTTKITSIESTLKLAALGDADKESVAIFETGLKLPVGVISSNLQMEPNPIGAAFESISYLLLAAVDPTAVITPQTWTDLEQVIVPGIEFTLLARNPLTFSMFGFQDTDLLETLQIIGTIRNVLASVITSSTNESLNDLRSSIENAISTADEKIIAWINQAEIVKSISVGANGALGAEAVGELGASIGVEGKVSGSLFLLLLNSPLYQIPYDPEKPDERGILSTAAMPIDVSLDLGASVGEGVELTVDAGGTVSMNLFELTVRHWEDELPTAALMKVAGFSVLEFEGTVNQDESLSGSGYLMLPMGGIVSATFSVDEFGNVTNGTWSGGLELGPLGDFPFIEGTLDNEGLHGTVNVGLLGSNFNANFILQSSGLLLGSYDGAINIAGHELAAASLSLGADGQFTGHYDGDISIGGFTANSVLDFNNEGISGNSLLKIFNSTLVSNDIVITHSGSVSGTFSGDIVAGIHTLSAVSLQAVNGGFIGTAVMDLPGIANAAVQLRIYNGKITAIYQGDLFNGLISQASFTISNSGIVMNANFDTTQFPNLSSNVLNLI
ncbi:MAG: hypothetical protein KAQ67_09505, partial [Gammaproteobacteria bacterium]|nr:hypothetical protein [Gammaproteobacteria bacterium]